MTTGETQLQAAILGALHAIGVLAWAVKMGNRGWREFGVRSKRHPTGFPDVLACVSGALCVLEVKLPGKENHGDKDRLAAQALCRQDVRAHGGVAEVVTSVEEAVGVVLAVREHWEDE